MTGHHGWFERELDHIRHPHTSTAPAAAATTIKTRTQEAPMTAIQVIEEIENDVKNFAEATAAKIAAVDKTALGVIEAVKVNPVGISIVNTIGRIAHLPDPMGLLNGIDGTLKAVEVVLTQAAQGTAPQPAATGPAVGGQA